MGQHICCLRSQVWGSDTDGVLFKNGQHLLEGAGDVVKTRVEDGTLSEMKVAIQDSADAIPEDLGSVQEEGGDSFNEDVSKVLHKGTAECSGSVTNEEVPRQTSSTSSASNREDIASASNEDVSKQTSTTSSVGRRNSATTAWYEDADVTSDGDDVDEEPVVIHRKTVHHQMSLSTDDVELLRTSHKLASVYEKSGDVVNGGSDADLPARTNEDVSGLSYWYGDDGVDLDGDAADEDPVVVHKATVHHQMSLSNDDVPLRRTSHPAFSPASADGRIEGGAASPNLPSISETSRADHDEGRQPRRKSVGSSWWEDDEAEASPA